jgi:hypothetical protein
MYLSSRLLALRRPTERSCLQPKCFILGLMGSAAIMISSGCLPAGCGVAVLRIEHTHRSATIRAQTHAHPHPFPHAHTPNAPGPSRSPGLLPRKTRPCRAAGTRLPCVPSSSLASAPSCRPTHRTRTAPRRSDRSHTRTASQPPRHRRSDRSHTRTASQPPRHTPVQHSPSPLSPPRWTRPCRAAATPPPRDRQRSPPSERCGRSARIAHAQPTMKAPLLAPNPHPLHHAARAHGLTLSAAWTDAPLASSADTTAVCPYVLACINAVRPYCTSHTHRAAETIRAPLCRSPHDCPRPFAHVVYRVDGCMFVDQQRHHRRVTANARHHQRGAAALCIAAHAPRSDDNDVRAAPHTAPHAPPHAPPHSHTPAHPRQPLTLLAASTDVPLLSSNDTTAERPFALAHISAV